MKNIFKYALMFIAAGSSALMVSSCSDDDDAMAEGLNRSFMTMFVTDYTRGKGTDYPYNCGLDVAYPHGNTIHLYWYGVKDCAGYQIQMAMQNKVANGPEAWAKIQGTNDLLLDTIMAPDQLQLLIKNLQYSTDYRFAIRALDKRDANKKGDPNSFAHASNWYGHGNGRQWQEYMGISTRDRYEVPYAVYADQSKTTENTMHIMINSNIKDFIATFENYASSADKIEAITDFTFDNVVANFTNLQPGDKDKLESYFTNFNVAKDGTFGYKYLQVQPSPNNPNSSVGEKWKKYEITDADRERGYIDIDGLSPNSVYVIDVIDPDVEVLMDAKYNTCTTRSDGTPGEPILLKHEDMMNSNPKFVDHESLDYWEIFALAKKYDAAPISHKLYDFISNTDLAEGQTFYLEGGKTYFINGNDITCKGFTLATDPADVAKGLRAKVICGIGKNSEIYSGTDGDQWQGSYTMFMFGRQPEAGEGGEIYMKKLAFYDIDFDNPTALNYGDNKAGVGVIAGNYFFNMYSDGMAVTLDSLVIENCSFKRLVRGFIREQGPNYKIWNHVLIKNNQFFDCGYYNNAAGGYPWIAGAGTNNKSNLFKDMKVIENTFYDSPFPSFFCQATDGMEWESGAWNITFENNTLVNFNTRASGVIFNMRVLPHRSVYNVKNNLFVLTKKDGDQRPLQFFGADIRGTQPLNDGSNGIVTLNFENNWSTNDNLTSGSIFSASPWTATSNNFGKLVKEQTAILNGTLEVNVANISSTELFISPCPPHVAQTTEDQNMHRADALDGTATTPYNVNLYYKNKDNEIVKAGAGAARWLNGPSAVRKRR